MLRRLSASLVAVLAPVLLAGCFHLHALLRVEADGSATLEETILLSGMLAHMMNEEGAPALYDADSLRAHATRLGPGVRLLRVDTLTGDEQTGYRAVYAVPDVSALRFHYNPRPLPSRDGGTVRTGDTENPILAGTSPDLPITFAFAEEGGAPVLRIRLPQPPAGGRAAELDAAEVAALTDSLRRQSAEGGAMARQILSQVRLGFEVEGPGPIAETDAAHVVDDAVTVFDFPLGAFVGLAEEKPELVARAQLLQRRGTPDVGPVLRALAAQPDTQYELRPEVRVRFAR